MISIIICGPADGFKAYRFPSVTLERDDTYALAGFELELGEGQLAYKISRKINKNDTENIRASLFKQTYEPNLRRAGHSFGVILEYSGTSLDIESVYEVISSLLEVVEEKCVRQGRFCDARTFDLFIKEFLQETFGQGISNAFAQLKNIKLHPLPHQASNKYVRDAYFYALDSSDKQRQLMEAWEWFLFSPGGCLIKSLVASSQIQQSNISAVTKIPDLRSLDRDATQILTEIIYTARNELRNKSAEIEIALGENKVIAQELMAAKEDAASLKTKNISLESKLSEQSLVVKSVIKLSDIESIVKMTVAAMNRENNAASAGLMSRSETRPSLSLRSEGRQPLPSGSKKNPVLQPPDVELPWLLYTLCGFGFSILLFIIILIINWLRSF